MRLTTLACWVVVAGVAVAPPTVRADRDRPGPRKPPASAAPEPEAAPAPKKSSGTKARAPEAAPEAEPGLQRVKIQRENVAVMSGPGSFHAKLGVLAKGTLADILSESGAWLQVRTHDLEGYIPRSALEAAKSGSSGLTKVFGSNQASASSETAAIKGFNPDVERAHAQSRGQDWSGVDWMDGNVVEAADVEEFLRQRGLLQ